MLSHRPILADRQNREDTDIPNHRGFVIFKDSAASLLYARRLRNNGIRGPITLVDTGPNWTNLPNVEDTDFVANNAHLVLRYLSMQKHHFIPYQGQRFYDCDGDSSPPVQREKIVQYFQGNGPSGDFMFGYYIPRVGPWFSPSTNPRLRNFVNQYTIKVQPNDAEITLRQRLQLLWGIGLTDSAITERPSIMNSIVIFLKEHRTGRREHRPFFSRQLFIEQYRALTSGALGSVQVINNARDIQFEQQDNGLYNILVENQILANRRVSWKTSPERFIETATLGGFPLNRSLMIPVFYRAVIPIPIIGSGAAGLTGYDGADAFVRSTGGCKCYCPPCFDGFPDGIDLTPYNPKGFGDYLTTYTAFSMYNLHTESDCSLAWLGAAYTTVEDLAVIGQEGKYAAVQDGYTLLIVEALSTQNRRAGRFDTCDNELKVYYNDPDVENGYLKQFAKMVSDIYLAYTGSFVPPNSLLLEPSTCSPIGICSDTPLIQDYTYRASPLSVVAQTGSNLYDAQIYQS